MAFAVIILVLPTAVLPRSCVGRRCQSLLLSGRDQHRIDDICSAVAVARRDKGRGEIIAQQAMLALLMPSVSDSVPPELLPE
jgi:hypothetical protein